MHDNKEMSRKRHDARAKLLFWLLKPIAFLTFSLLSPASSNLKVPNVKPRCYLITSFVPAIVAIIDKETMIAQELAFHPER